MAITGSDPGVRDSRTALSGEKISRLVLMQIKPWFDLGPAVCG